MGTEFNLILQYKHMSFEVGGRDVDFFGMIEVVNDVKQTFHLGNLGGVCPKYFSVKGVSPRSKYRETIMSDKQLRAFIEKWLMKGKKKICLFVELENKQYYVGGGSINKIEQEHIVQNNIHTPQIPTTSTAGIPTTQTRYVLNRPDRGLDDISEDDDNEDHDFRVEGEVEDELDDVLSDGFVVDEDELFNCSSDEEENPFKNSFVGGHSWELREDRVIELREGDMFPDKQSFLNIFRDYMIQERFYVKYFKNERGIFTVRCLGEHCKWYLHASFMPDKATFQIKTINGGEHTCVRIQDNPAATAKWVAKKMVDEVRANPCVPILTLQQNLTKTFGVVRDIQLIRRAKHLMHEMIEGSHEDGFLHLVKYLEMMKSVNPGTTTDISYAEPAIEGEKPVFRRLFFSLGVCKEGFMSGCRKFIGVDGCHLKGPYKGILLTAMGLDGDNHCYPLAFAIVDQESKASWCYFLNALKIVLGDLLYADYTFIADRCKGVISAIETVFPAASRRICMVHYTKNFKKYFHSPRIHMYMSRAANAYTEGQHTKAMNVLGNEDLKAYNWLIDEPLPHWCRHLFNTSNKVDDNTSNFVESFNKVLNNVRLKPICFVLEEIVSITIKWRVQWLNAARDWEGRVVPRVKDRLDVLERESRYLNVSFCGEGVYVVTEGRTKYIVNFGLKTCNCRVWDLSGIPCKHAVKCLLFMGETTSNWVDDYYTIERFIEAYIPRVNPIPDIEFWPSMPSLPLLSPPHVTKKVGRPQKDKRRASEEAQKRKRATTITCTNCSGLGHNSVTCPMSVSVDLRVRPARPSTGRRRGRPRKVEKQPIQQELRGGLGQFEIGQSSSQPSPLLFQPEVLSSPARRFTRSLNSPTKDTAEDSTPNQPIRLKINPRKKIIVHQSTPTKQLIQPSSTESSPMSPKSKKLKAILDKLTAALL